MNHGRITISNEENGARFNIADSNLMEVLSMSNLENFRITANCIIAKERGRYLLIPENSEDYIILISRVDLPSIRLSLGHTYRVRTNSGEKNITYLGAFYKGEIKLKPGRNASFNKKGELEIPRAISSIFTYSSKDLYFYEDNNIVSYRRKNLEIVEDLGVNSDFDTYKKRYYTLRELLKSEQSYIVKFFSKKSIPYFSLGNNSYERELEVLLNYKNFQSILKENFFKMKKK